MLNHDTISIYSISDGKAAPYFTRVSQTLIVNYWYK